MSRPNRANPTAIPFSAPGGSRNHWPSWSCPSPLRALAGIYQAHGPANTATQESSLSKFAPVRASPSSTFPGPSLTCTRDSGRTGISQLLHQLRLCALRPDDYTPTSTLQYLDSIVKLEDSST